MKTSVRPPWRAFAVAAAATLMSATPALAQTVTGEARAIQAVVSSGLGNSVTTLADTGTLTAPDDARQASAVAGSVPALVTADVLHATSIGMTTSVDSEASLADLAVTVGGSTIGADFVMSRVSTTTGLATATVTGLVIDGVPFPVSATPNQTVAIPGGQIVINEQQTSATLNIVNALHITVYGVADVVVASATAGVQ